LTTGRLLQKVKAGGTPRNLPASSSRSRYMEIGRLFNELRRRSGVPQPSPLVRRGRLKLAWANEPV
jgi:hypothetical protein